MNVHPLPLFALIYILQDELRLHSNEFVGLIPKELSSLDLLREFPYAVIPCFFLILADVP